MSKTWYQLGDETEAHKHLGMDTSTNAIFSKSKVKIKFKKQKSENPIVALNSHYLNKPVCKLWYQTCQSWAESDNDFAVIIETFTILKKYGIFQFQKKHNIFKNSKFSKMLPVSIAYCSSWIECSL